MAIEPMNRKAGSSISRDKSAAKWASRGNNYDPSHVDFGQCARVANFLIVCVSKRFFSVTINQLRDGARFPTVWSKMWFQNISRSWTSKLLANWLMSSSASRLVNFNFESKFQIKKYSPLWFRVRRLHYESVFQAFNHFFCRWRDWWNIIDNQTIFESRMR
jgi:hypothetical protein